MPAASAPPTFPFPPSLPLPVVGVVLTGGASTRMGCPKALLPMPDGLPLAARQVLTLLQAGCKSVLVVGGAHFDPISDALAALPAFAGLPWRLLLNPNWRKGRITTVQTALHALKSPYLASAALFLPVDAAGIRPETLFLLLSAFQKGLGERKTPLRPTYNGQKGNALLVPAAQFEAILALPPTDRLDQWAAPRALPVPLPDPALLANCNTPAQWSDLRGNLARESR